MRGEIRRGRSRAPSPSRSSWPGFPSSGWRSSRVRISGLRPWPVSIPRSPRGFRQAWRRPRPPRSSSTRAPSRKRRWGAGVPPLGAVCACLACRRLRMPPREFVDGSYGVSIPLEEMREAVQAVRHLLGALHYRGVFNAEFKYDERDGRFKILEVNARPWSDVGFTIACGVDVIEMAYRDALGLPVQPVTEYVVGRSYLDPSPDLAAGWRLLREGRLTLRTWLRSWPGATQMIFSWD